MSRDNKFVDSLQNQNKELSRRIAKFETWEPDYPLGGNSQWDDERVPVTSTTLGGANNPDFSVFMTDGAGSTGVFTYMFDSIVEQELFFSIQLSHAYKEGSDIYPHVHWTPVSNGAVGQVVSWGLEYTWANIGDIFPNTTIVYANVHTPADASLVASKHYLTSFGPISGSGKTISSMLVCRIFRNPTGAGGSADDYPADAGMLEVDFHIEKDSIGSNELYLKD